MSHSSDKYIHVIRIEEEDRKKEEEEEEEGNSDEQ